MTTTNNLNIAPYFSDFDSFKNFYQVLFKSGVPLQGRELNTVQEILQDQISQFGKKLMSPGETVIPGGYTYTNPIGYVKIQQITSGYTPSDFIGSTIKGVTSGVKATVEFTSDLTETDAITFFVKYIDSGTSKTNNIFAEGEILESDTQNKLTAVVGVSNQIKPLSSPAIGNGCIFNIASGSYFINGFIVRNYDQTIIVDKYSTTPTCTVGFLVTESFVTSNEDESLLDNSQGYSNFAAPGADRLKIDLTLIKLDEDVSSPENFIRLVSILQGNIQGSQIEDVKWKWLFDILAKRTYNESGDYIVKDFTISPLEYTNSNDHDGVYNPDENGLYPPIDPKVNTAKLNYDDAEKYYVLNMGAGLAYVQGHEVGYNSSFYLTGEKARDTNIILESSIIVNSGSNFRVSNVYGAPDIQNINTTLSSSVALTDIIVYNMFTDGFNGETIRKISYGSNTKTLPYNAGNPAQYNYHIVCRNNFPDGVDTSSLGNNFVYARGKSIVVKPSTYPSTEYLRGSTILSNEILYVFRVPPLPCGVLRPVYFDYSNPIQNDSDYLNYNSEFKMGSAIVKYFTHLNVFGNKDFIVGEVITGDNSKATGVIEEGCAYDVDSDGHHILVVSNVIGEFEPGEIITQGSKVASIAKNGEATALVMSESAGSNNQQSFYDSIIFITVKALESSLTLTKTVDPSTTHFFYNTTRREFQLTPLGRNFIYNNFNQLFVGFDKRINYKLEFGSGVNTFGGFIIVATPIIKQNAQSIKSFYSNLVDYNNFSADISTQNRSSLDNFIISEGLNFSGTAGNNYVVCSSYVGNAGFDLDRGDIITMVDSNGDDQAYVVLFTTVPFGVGTNITPSHIYLTTTLKENINSSQVVRVRAKRQGSTADSLIYPLSQDVVKTIKPSSIETKINYQVYREYITVYAGSTQSNIVTLTTGKPNEKFVGDLSDLLVTVIKNNGNNSQTNYYEGTYLKPVDVSLSEQDTKMTITFNSVAQNLVLKIIARVDVVNALPKIKTLITYTDVAVETATTKKPIVIWGEDALDKIISLKITDVIKVNKILSIVKVKNTQAFVSITDITNNYNLDTGQRDNYYDISRLELKPGYLPPVEQTTATNYWYLEVHCTAFEHGTEGDFFSVDSYTHAKGISYENIPTYISTIASLTESKKVIPLRDAVDFRPTVNTYSEIVSGVERHTPSKIAAVDPTTDEQNAINFLSSSVSINNNIIVGNGNVGGFMVPGSKFKCNIEYYMGRIDSVFLHNTGNISIMKGISDLNPKRPEDISTGIRLYDLTLPPYVFDIKDIYIKKYNYRRYTMKDISILDRRIDRVEEVVSLSLLEQSALNTQVRDSITGLDRYKNGFIADAFNNHANGDLTNPEYICSIDPHLSALRPPFTSNQIELEENSQTESQRAFNGYTRTGQLITLPYKSVSYVKNEFATRTEAVQPFSMFIYDGSIELVPSVDTWHEVRVRPKIVIEDNALWAATVASNQRLIDANVNRVWSDWSPRVPNSNVNNRWRQNRFRTVFSQDTSTKNTIETSQGTKTVDFQILRTMRSVPVLFTATKLRPNTEYIAYFDSIDVSRWISCDMMTTVIGDNRLLYRSAPNSNPLGFGSKIISDVDGKITGLFLVPQGFAPTIGSKYTGDITKINYDNTSITRNFETGVKEFKLVNVVTDNSTNIIATASSNFTSSGSIEDKQETVISTRQPPVLNRNVLTNKRDPVAQTFLIDQNSPNGVFVTELDIYFATKDDNEGVMVYLTPTEGGRPTDTIIPFSITNKESDSIIRVQCNLSPTVSTETLVAGVKVLGVTSGAVGIVKNEVKFNSAVVSSTANVTNTVYDLVLSNYSGEFIPGESIIPQASPLLSSSFNIVQNEFVVSRIDVRNLGQNYSGNLTIDWSSPDFPGGQKPTTIVRSVDGKIYRIELLTSGSGYTHIPTATIKSSTNTGSGCILSVRVKENRKAVEMGVATSADATVPTKFKFPSPVYLLGNTTYAFVVKAPNSIKYSIYLSRLGENRIGTNNRVVSQPLTGSFFRSQNSSLWTENQFDDMTFNLYRADFVVGTSGKVTLENAPLGMETMPIDPIETYSHTGSSHIPTNGIFGEDPKIVKIYMDSHGHTSGDSVLIEEIVANSGSTLNGIPITELNKIHTVIDASFNEYTIRVSTAANKTGTAGGSIGKCSIGRLFEVMNLVTGSLTFENTNNIASVQTTSAKTILSSQNQIDVDGKPFTSYELSPIINVVNNSNYFFIKPQQCASYINEAVHNGDLNLKGNRSLTTYLTLSTTNSEISPVFDYDRSNAILVHNLINKPEGSDFYGSQTVVATFDQNISNPGRKIYFDDELHHNAKLYEANVMDIDSTNNRMIISAKDISYFTDHSFILDSKKKSLLTNNNKIISISSINQKNLIKETTSSGGSTFAKWISKEFRLENASDGLDIKMSAVIYERDSIRVYYKLRREGFDGTLTDLNWIPFNDNGVCNNNSQVKIRSSDIVDPNQFAQNDVIEYTWSVQNLPNFYAFTIKIIMTAINPAKCPVIMDFRAIASE